MRILPGPIRKQIGLAYLLARATDTIADTEALPVEERLTALRELKEAVFRDEFTPVGFSAIQQSQSNPAEAILLKRVNEAVRLLFQFEAADRARIQKVLGTITHGQELDLARFGRSSAADIKALRSVQELDDYTYAVAGCVGEFWTEICVAHLQPSPKADLEAFMQRGIRFGKGLQLVNILRDIPADLRMGRCYIPEEQLGPAGITPASLLDPRQFGPFSPSYNFWLKRARQHLEAGWQYVLDLPRSWYRVRLACAWPILIGRNTLEKLEDGNVLNPDTRIKTSRKEVKQMMRRSVLALPFSGSWRRLPETMGRKANQA